MKKILLIAALAIVAAAQMQANPDLRDLLKGLGGSSDTKEETSTEQTDNSKSSGSSLLGSLESIGTQLGLIPERSVDVAYLAGKWSYKSAAVAFKSDNLLKKAGGVAAASTIEGKLEPYYKKLGFSKMTLEVAADSTFKMGVGKITLSGTITPDTDNKTLVFNFRALKGKIPAGSMAAYVNAENKQSMAITFDVSKLIDLMQKVGSFTGSSSIKAVSSLLSSYDGLTAGFKMTKTAEAAAK